MLAKVFRLLSFFYCSTFAHDALSDELVLGFIEKYPPYSYQENGFAAGSHIEKIRGISTQAGVSIIAEFLPLQQALKKAEDGLLDGVVGAAYREDRAQYLDYIKFPVFECVTVSLHTLEHSMSLNNMMNQRAVLAAKIGFDLGRKLNDDLVSKGIELYRFSDINPVLRLMRAGRVQGIIHADKEVDYFAQSLGVTLYKSEEILNQEPTYIAFSKKISEHKKAHVEAITKAMQFGANNTSSCTVIAQNVN
ncbi:substrate-binding periplasmic protein [Pseudoalteromonas sp. SSDWG2]|uniref:substrate-binding periplasmic protein n=1 Tax=Pseudoalteromonas sp. SSDWG2 TaxID=3139391 RepID=UPI003BA96689